MLHFFQNYNPVHAKMCMLCVALLEIAHQSPQDFYSMTLDCAAYISPTILTIILSSQVFSIDMAAQLRIGWMLSSVARQTLCNRMHSYSYVSFWSFLFHTNLKSKIIYQLVLKSSDSFRCVKLGKTNYLPFFFSIISQWPFNED